MYDNIEQQKQYQFRKKMNTSKKKRKLMKPPIIMILYIKVEVPMMILT